MRLDEWDSSHRLVTGPSPPVGVRFCVFGCGTVHFGNEFYRGLNNRRCPGCVSGSPLRVLGFPRPPDPLLRLELGDDVTATYFRADARIFNIVYSFARYNAREHQVASHGVPTFFVEGVPFTLLGSIEQAEGHAVSTMQVYRMDGDNQHQHRINFILAHRGR